MKRFARKRFLPLWVMLSFALVSPARSEEQPQTQQQQQEPPKAAIRLITPVENATATDKKPRIKCAIDVPYSPEGFLVMLDNADITGVLDRTPDGFEYAPVLVLPPGQHMVSVRLLTRDGRETQQQFGFTTRHGETFEAAYSNNELTIVVEDLLRKPPGATSVPESKVEGNLRSDARLATANSTVSFSTNLRYLNESAAVFEPQKKGVVDAANWILNGAYAKDRFRLDTSIGDIVLEQTPYTLMNLARRGGKAGVDFDGRYHLDFFSVTSRQIIGFREGAGIGSDTDDHILGMSAGVKLLEKTVELKTLYITGGTQDNYFGTFPRTEVTQKGNVAGFVVNTDFFSGRFRTEIEGDSSTYDPDISDEFRAATDRAYKARAYGFVDRYTYEALYEHIGRDYAVVGSQGLQKDREGASVRGGANLDGHGLNLMVSRYYDNVEKDELFPRIVNGQAVFDYQYAKIPNLTLGLAYQRNRQNTVKEPAGSAPVETQVNGVTGRAGYRLGNLAVGFQAGCSRMNDLTAANRDSRTIAYALTPSYNVPGLSLNPVLSFNKATDLSSDVTTNTATVNLDVRSGFLGGRITFDLGGSYNAIKSDNELTDQRMLNAGFRLAYIIKDYFKEYLRPSIGLRGTYARTDDRIAGTETKELTAFLVLAASMPFSF